MSYRSKIRPITMPLMDYEKYMGLWHELAKIPFVWENDCDNATALYSLNKDDTIHVINSCFMKGRKVYSREGTLRLNKEFYNDPGKLNLKFGDGLPSDNEAPYWIHWTDYKNFALVGGPSGNFVWILGRKNQISKYELDNLMTHLHMLGYDISKIKVTCKII